MIAQYKTVIGLFAVLLATLGCGGAPEGPAMFGVSGKVTFDGEPIEDGRITFRQTEPPRKAFSSEIVNGEYSLQAEAGAMEVRVIASRPIPGKFDNSNGTPEPVGEMYIPKKYNDNTELTATVTDEGDNEFNFDLTAN
ncbi:hypothetical protein [Thalassoroseus pseudoceratinae]|uniref:hypothetical protein n=1 Tax=Thalassoroseus pseudoceratinae TaxID=2713176 RepID=UPI00197CCC6D|nr:hypothetical protein [Thalassoroseus pseudoceratinae]